jgi:indole-3-glycerol phosphate synthase / phosphoribosylanthranilate isomerase
MSRLDDVVVRKRAEIEARRRRHPVAELEQRAVSSTRSLGAALGRPGLRFVLECKQASPSTGVLRADYDPAALARSFAGVADAISVLTDGPWFRGSLDHLAAVRRATQLPLLCKDFILDPFQVLEARVHGADAVLLMLSLLDDAGYRRAARAAAALGMDVLTEVHDDAELDRALRLDARIIGINNRNLATLAVDRGTAARLASRIPRDRLIVCESGIRHRADVDAVAGQVDAFLIGTGVMREARPDLAARAIAFGPVKVCGLMTPDDAALAHAAGATLGGVVFAAESPRRVDERQAAAIAAGPLPLVGVFVNEPIERTVELARRLALAAVQLHGEETAEHVAAVRSALPPTTEVWKAMRVADRIPPVPAGADRMLLDARHASLRGGTGRRFDWQLLQGLAGRERLVLAGGLDAGNVREAQRLGFGALDVSSGVESAPGVKDPARLDAFFGALRGAA